MDELPCMRRTKSLYIFYLDTFAGKWTPRKNYRNWSRGSDIKWSPPSSVFMCILYLQMGVFIRTCSIERYNHTKWCLLPTHSVIAIAIFHSVISCNFLLRIPISFNLWRSLCLIAGWDLIRPSLDRKGGFAICFDGRWRSYMYFKYRLEQKSIASWHRRKNMKSRNMPLKKAYVIAEKHAAKGWHNNWSNYTLALISIWWSWAMHKFAFIHKPRRSIRMCLCYRASTHTSYVVIEYICIRFTYIAFYNFTCFCYSWWSSLPLQWPRLHT